MERRHYNLIADVIATAPYENSLDRARLIVAFVEALKETNPRFDEERFVEAAWDKGERIDYAL
jgi:hypothetical protein